MLYSVPGNSMFIRRGEKHELTWIAHATLSELYNRCYSPKFKTDENVEWVIVLRTRPSSMDTDEADFFCILIRLPDSGPSEIRYSVHCKIFIGQEMLEHKRRQRQPSKDYIFSKGSSVNFRLMSVSAISKFVDSNLSTKPVKVTIKVFLQSKSYERSRCKSHLAVTELRLFSRSMNVFAPNHFYQGRKKESDEKSESKNYLRDMSVWNYSKITFGGSDSEANTWYPIHYVMDFPNCVDSSQIHILDVHGNIYASSVVRKYESDEQKTVHQIPILRKSDLKENIDTLSHDGEINFRYEESRSLFPFILQGSQIWICTSRRVEATLREDLERLSRSCRKGKNAQIRSGGEVFDIHKEIICARSPVFKTMMSSNMIEKQSSVIVLDKMHLRAFKNFINYLYSAALDNSMRWGDVCNLHRMAHMYSIPSLFRACSKKFALSITLENCEQLMARSQLFKDKELQSSVEEFFKFLNENNHYDYENNEVLT